jgi:hypothetical protein
MSSSFFAYFPARFCRILGNFFPLHCRKLRRPGMTAFESSKPTKSLRVWIFAAGGVAS